MATHQPIVGGIAAPAPDITRRAFPALATPQEAGPSCWAAAPRPPASWTASWRIGGAGSKIVVIAAGYAKRETRDEGREGLRGVACRGWRQRDLVRPQLQDKDGRLTAALSAAKGVLLTAPDPATVRSSLPAGSVVTAAIHDAWLRGAALLANDAAASAISAGFTADARPGRLDRRDRSGWRF